MKVRNLEIGSGRPKICVPVTGLTCDDILKQAEAVVQSPADMIEWRADRMQPFPSVQEITETAAALRNIVGERPVLFTIRTKAEGGNADISDEKYGEACRLAAESGYIDLVDIEILAHGSQTDEIIKAVHETGTGVVLSSHNFTSTPSAELLFRLFTYMNIHGGDILKIAVMPNSRGDVMNLLDASYAASQKFDKPVIAISMGQPGMLSRISGEITGSAITFASVGEGSAPGQLSAQETARILDLLSGK